MRLNFEENLGKNYKSQSQKARVLSEAWVDDVVFCPNCGNYTLDQYENNRPVADFSCRKCHEEYELKSKQNTIGNKIVDGAYRTMIKRLTSNHNPNFFLLNYDSSSFGVKDFFVIPKHFFVPGIIEERKPLAPTAQRAGWVGCNILLQRIPQTGKIFFVRNKRVEPKEKVLLEWKKTLFLREEKEVSAKGWLLDIMRCIEKLKVRAFELADLYTFEKELSKLHPENKHVKDKVRQQLQVLRDKNYLDFVSSGHYRLV